MISRSVETLAWGLLLELSIGAGANGLEEDVDDAGMVVLVWLGERKNDESFDFQI